MKLKKLLCAVLASALFCAAFTGCGKVAATPNAEEMTASADENTLRLTQESTVKGEKYAGRDEFATFLADASPCFTVPALAQAMVPQGMSYSADTGLVYISSYAGGDSIPSILTAVDYNSGELRAEYFLYNPDGTPFTSHVGGVAVTESRIYISAKPDNDGNYSIASAPLDAFPPDGSHNVTLSDTTPVPVSPSFLSCCVGRLYVGNFYHPDADYKLSPEIDYTTPADGGDYGCYIMAYPLENGMLPEFEGKYPLPEYVLCAPDKIQGVALRGGTITLSESYGRKNNSQLLEYAFSAQEEADASITLLGETLPMYILDGARLTGSYTAMPMTEALCIVPDGMLVLFESGALKFGDGKYRTDAVWKLN